MKHLLAATMVTVLFPFIASAQEQAASAQEKEAQQRPPNFNHLQILVPFLGRWVYEGPAKRTVPGFLKEGTPLRVEMVYRWVVNKNAIVLNVSIHAKGAKEFKIVEMIGWDVKRQIIVSGAFNTAGGMSYGRWTVDENRLLIKTRDVSDDGTESSSTIIHELQDKDRMTWSETDRVVDGEKRPDSPTYEFKRLEKIE